MTVTELPSDGAGLVVELPHEVGEEQVTVVVNVAAEAVPGTIR